VVRGRVRPGLGYTSTATPDWREERRLLGSQVDPPERQAVRERRLAALEQRMRQLEEKFHAGSKELGRITGCIGVEEDFLSVVGSSLMTVIRRAKGLGPPAGQRRWQQGRAVGPAVPVIQLMRELVQDNIISAARM